MMDASITRESPNYITDILMPSTSILGWRNLPLDKYICVRCAMLRNFQEKGLLSHKPIPWAWKKLLSDLWLTTDKSTFIQKLKTQVDFSSLSNALPEFF